MSLMDRRQRVSIEVSTETSDGHDGFTTTWAVRHRRWSAQVRPLTGRDLEHAKQIDPRISHEVVLGYWRAYEADLDGGRVRLIYHPTNASADDRTFEVVTPPLDRDERHEDILLLCREQVA